MSDPRYERLRPRQIEAALGRRSLIYVPLGTYEWHGYHLPVGLDALAAHGICLRAAARTGGLVLPPVYYGTGGAHGAYPWTIMMPGAAELRGLLEQTLARLADFHVAEAVLFSGHFAGEQVALIRSVADAWNGRGAPPRVQVLSDAMLPDLPCGPDHAAIFETTLMMALDAETVKLDELPDPNAFPANDPDGNAWGPQRGEPRHPLYGIYGTDPRTATPEQGADLLRRLVDWVVATLGPAPPA